jgi:purine-binding chemotaxis protein CheW
VKGDSFVQGSPAGRDAESRERTAKILRARAKDIASEPETGRPAVDGMQIVEFALGDERYAVPSAQVLAVRLLGEFTPVPCTPAMVLGVVNHRGRLLSVIDLGTLFGWPAKKPGRLDQAILIHDAGMEFGIRADTVMGVGTLFPEDLHPPLPTLAVSGETCLQGVTGDGLIVLDARRLLLDNRIIVHEEVK